MNALSWMIYFAEVSDSIRWFVWFSTLVGALAMIVCIFMIVSSLVSEEEALKKLEKYKQPDDYKDALSWITTVQGLSRGFFRWLLPLVFVCFFVASFMPSKQTIMLIAASQVGESFLTSDAAKNIGGVGLETVNTLNDYLRSLIPKPEVSKN